MSASCSTPTRAEVLVADIGSTLTKLSAFRGLEANANHPPAKRARFLGQGCARTTVSEGDVGLGLAAARQDLETRCHVDASGARLMAASSAGGGLRMTVHGLTQDMTLRAAREASLGAGAIVAFATAGCISADDLEQMRQLKPNLILLAGGVDYGDRETVVANARALASSDVSAPVLYAGNKAAKEEVKRLLQAAGATVYMAENVYPRLDELHIETVRRAIQEVFARHIVAAPGMDAVKTLITGAIMPTPGAVMRSAELAAAALDDVLVVDVGGATTDVHSVTRGSPVYAKMKIAPEPRSKRTVEGDLGVYINAANIVAAAEGLHHDPSLVMAVPDHDRARQATAALTQWAVDIAVWRHAGDVKVAYGAYGRQEWVEGRDLTAIRYVIGTGGALIRLGIGRDILGAIRVDPMQKKLLPPRDAYVLLDQHYIMAAVGVLSQHYPEAAKILLRDSLTANREDDQRAWPICDH